MKYRTNQKNGDELSIFGFGCMRLPTKAGIIDEKRAIKMIRDSIEKGVNYFDTAYIYHAGQSESFLGKALQDGYRQRVKIAGKHLEFSGIVGTYHIVPLFFSNMEVYFIRTNV